MTSANASIDWSRLEEIIESVVLKMVKILRRARILR